MLPSTFVHSRNAVLKLFIPFSKMTRNVVLPLKKFIILLHLAYPLTPNIDWSNFHDGDSMVSGHGTNVIEQEFRTMVMSSTILQHLRNVTANTTKRATANDNFHWQQLKHDFN